MIAIDEVLIDFVSHDQHLRVITQHLGQRLQLGKGVNSTAGVVGAVEDDPLGTRRYRLFKLGGRQLETVVFMALDNDRGSAIQAGDIRVGNPVRRMDDNLVPRIEGSRQRFKNDLLAARCGHHLFDAVLQAIVTGEFGDDGLAQGRGAQCVGVVSIAGLHRLACGLNDMRRCVEVRLTHCKVDDVPAFCAKLRHQGVGGDTRGWGNTQHSPGQKRVVHFVFFSQQTGLNQGVVVPQQTSRSMGCTLGLRSSRRR